MATAAPRMQRSDAVGSLTERTRRRPETNTPKSRTARRRFKRRSIGLQRCRPRRRQRCSLNALVKRAGQVLSPCNFAAAVSSAAAAADHFPTDLSAADKLQIVQLWSELEEGGPRRDDATAEAEAGPGNFCFEEFRRPD